MRILMLSDVYFPRVNGVSASMQTFARELQRTGHQVTIVAPDYGSGDDGEFEIVRVPARVIFFDPEDRLMRTRAARAAIQPLARRRWDVIHIHTPFVAHRIGVQLGRELRCPTIESYHTLFEEYAAHYLPWLPGALLRFGARRFSRMLCREVDHLIVPSAQMATLLQRYGLQTPHSIIPTGIRLEEFAGGDGGRFRAAHGIAPQRPVLVTVSRLAAEKNITFLLDVARMLATELPQLLFVIAGEGPDSVRLKARAEHLGLKDNVLFVGNLDRRTELLDCYRAGDVFVFASPTETQGLVLLEAMALGVPIVSTAVMGTESVLANAHGARISPPDVASFAGHVGALLGDPADRARLAAAGPDDARAWSAPTLMQRVVTLYEGLAATASGAPMSAAPAA